MENIFVYSGVSTKIRGMHARLLTTDNYNELASLHNTTEVISYLKGHAGYRAILKNINEMLLHRGDAEKLFTLSLYRDYSKLYSFSSGEPRKFLKLYFKRYEIELINYCFRIIFNHYDVPLDLKYKKDFFDRYSKISIDKLLTSTTIEALIENLKDTEYYKPLKIIQNSAASSLFDYDLALNLYYFTTLWKQRGRFLSKHDYAIFTKDYGTKIDLLNLQWVCRAKKNYSMYSTDIHALLIPIHYKLSENTFKELIETTSTDDFETALKKTSYYRKYNLEKGLNIEALYKDCLGHIYLIDRRKYPYSIAAINTYLFLKEEECSTLTTILESIRYGLPTRQILEYIGDKPK